MEQTHFQGGSFLKGFYSKKKEFAPTENKFFFILRAVKSQK